MATTEPAPVYPVSSHTVVTPCTSFTSSMAMVRMPSSSTMTTPGRLAKVPSLLTSTGPARASMSGKRHSVSKLTWSASIFSSAAVGRWSKSTITPMRPSSSTQSCRTLSTAIGIESEMPSRSRSMLVVSHHGSSPTSEGGGVTSGVTAAPILGRNRRANTARLAHSMRMRRDTSLRLSAIISLSPMWP